MTIWLTVATAMYVILALAHSWLGERDVVRPLLRASWEIGLPRGFAAPLLRWAWHLTSLAWVAAAAVLAWAAAGHAVPTPILDVLAGLALVSGAVIGVALRGAHPAWAVFVIGGMACLVGAHGWPSSTVVRGASGATAAVVLLALGALHVYWAAGGRRGTNAVVPTRADGTALLRPSALASLAVAGLLFAAAVLVASAAELGPRVPWARALSLLIAAGFTARLVGDFRFAGLFKRELRTPFARWDSMLFSPLCGALAVACAVAAG